MKTLYLAGPMSNIPAFNFPAFIAAAALLRDAGWNIVSPAETDPEDVRAVAMASPDGKYDADGKVGSETWGDMLARDVKMLADGFPTEQGVETGRVDAGGNPEEVGAIVLEPIDGICFLPNWHMSKGARLEAFVGLLAGKEFYRYSEDEGGAVAVTPAWVKAGLALTWLSDIHGVDPDAFAVYAPLHR